MPSSTKVSPHHRPLWLYQTKLPPETVSKEIPSGLPTSHQLNSVPMDSPEDSSTIDMATQQVKKPEKKGELERDQQREYYFDQFII
jgi:hypothetical protein